MCVCVCVIILSCKKNEELITNTTPNAIPHWAQPTESDVKNFVEQMKSTSNLELRTNYSAAQALVLLNHGLNYQYCRNQEPDASVTYQFIDTLSVTLNQDGSISESNLNTLYAAIATTAGTHFYQQTDTTKRPFAFDINYVGTPVNNVQLVESTFQMVSGLGGGQPHYPYNTGNTWWFYQNYGACPNQNINTFDVCDILRFDLNKNEAYHNKFGGYYFTGKQAVCFFVGNGHNCYGAFEVPLNGFASKTINGNALLNPNDVTYADNWYDFLVFHLFPTPNYHVCLNDSELNYYYQSNKQLAISENPQDKVLGLFEIGWDIIPSGDPPKLSEALLANYYTLNCITIDTDGDELPDGGN